MNSLLKNLLVVFSFLVVGFFIPFFYASASVVYTQPYYSEPPLMSSYSTDYLNFNTTLGKFLFTSSFQGNYLKSVSVKVGPVPLPDGGCYDDFQFQLFAYNNTDTVIATSTNKLDLADLTCGSYNDFTFNFPNEVALVNDISYFRVDGGTYRQHVMFYGLGYPNLQLGNGTSTPYMIINDYTPSLLASDYDWRDISSFDPEAVYFSMVKPKEFRTETNNSFYWVTATTTYRTWWGINTELATSSLSDISFSVFDKNGNGTSTQLISLLAYASTSTNPMFRYQFYYDFDTTDFAFASTSQYTVIIQDLYTLRYHYVKTLNFVTDPTCTYCGIYQDNGSQPGSFLGDFTFGSGEFGLLNDLFSRIPLVYISDIFEILSSFSLVSTSTISSSIVIASSTYGTLTVDPLNPGPFSSIITLIRFLGTVFTYILFGFFILEWSKSAYAKLTE